MGAAERPWYRSRLGVLGLVFCVAVVCRILLISVVEYRFDRGDAASYGVSAMNIVEHGVHSHRKAPPYEPTVYRPPLYAAFVAAIYTTFGHRPGAVQAVQIVAGALVACLFGCAVGRLSAPAGVFSMWACALSPFDAWYAGALLSESLCAGLLALALAAVVFLHGTVRAVAFGAGMGLLVLTRDSYLLLLPAAALLWTMHAWRTAGRRTAARHAVVAVLALMVVVAPWTLRNYAVTGRVIPVSEGRLGFSLWIGGWATSDAFTRGDSERGRAWPPEAFRSEDERRRLLQADIDSAGKAAEADRAYRDAFLSRLRAEPLQVVGRWMRRAPRLWTGTRTDVFTFRSDWFPRDSPAWWTVKGLSLALNSAVLAAAAFGLLLAWRHRSPLRWLALPLVYTAVVHFPLHGLESRYTQPVYMFLFPFVMLAAAWLGAWRASPAAAWQGGNV